jgi:quercetin dioxygenase-like cupin family protein
MTNLIPNLMSLQVRNRTQVAEDEGTGLPEQNGLLISQAEASKVAKTTNSDEIELSEFLVEVEETPAHLMTPERLAFLVKRLVRNKNFRDLVNRYVLYRPDRAGVLELPIKGKVSGLVASLLPGQKVPSHAHGESCEVGLVLAGTLTVIDYKLTEDREVVPDLATEVGEGGIFVTERYAQHHIQNKSGAKTVSVNFHSPGWSVSK